MSNPKQSTQATRTSRRQAAKKQEAETEADAEEEREVDIATNDADINNAGEQQTALAEVETEHWASQSNEEMTSCNDSSPEDEQDQSSFAEDEDDSEDLADEDSEQDSGGWWGRRLPPLQCKEAMGELLPEDTIHDDQKIESWDQRIEWSRH